MAELATLVRSDAPVFAAAELLAKALERAPARPRLAIPGGSAVAALGPARARLGDAWGAVRLTWVDERCVPAAHAESNRGAAYRTGVLDAAAPPSLELPRVCDGETGAEAVARVERALDRDLGGALDVVLLGMGEDGHVASLFPGQSVDRGRVAHVTASPKPPPERITLTRAFLGTARETVLLATGESKRAALARLLAGDASLPAHGLAGLVVVTDLEGVEIR
ncbi:MAG: 6-phosphogluconolactonase [Myxococcota bacterium]|nr:6-phosphogluconolactonase [Myxococcota bacterium]